MSSSPKYRSENVRLLLGLFSSFLVSALLTLAVFSVLFNITVVENEVLLISMLAITCAAFGSLASFFIVWLIKKKPKNSEVVPEPVVFAAHELRAPAAGAKWALGSLLTGSGLTPHDREIVSQSFEAIGRVIEIATDILTTAQLDQAGSMHFKDASIVSLAGAATKDLALRADQKKIRIWIENQSGDQEIKAYIDPEKIFTVIDNLIDNAIRYSHNEGEIMIILNKDDTNAHIAIKDRGIGIPKADQRNIFSKFFRASNARRIESNGTGLGLFLNKTIVDRHHGQIWFESAEGKGSTFHVTLPLRHKK
jgi:signal transduction histidine kinase